MVSYYQIFIQMKNCFILHEPNDLYKLFLLFFYNKILSCMAFFCFCPLETSHCSSGWYRRGFMFLAGLGWLWFCPSNARLTGGMYHNAWYVWFFWMLYFASLPLVKSVDSDYVCVFKPWITYQSQHRISIRIQLVLLLTQELKQFIWTIRSMLVPVVYSLLL